MCSIYLDHNATTPMDPGVLDSMLPWLGAGLEEGRYGNPSSVHSLGQRARGAVERARQQVAALIGARAPEIVFTSGGTESDNTAIFGAFPPSKPGHIVTTAIEHPAVLAVCALIEKHGIELSCVPVGADGVVDPEDIRRALRPDTRLISVMHANNEVGSVQPIAEIGRIAAEAGVLFHCDAVQSAGKLAIDVSEMGVHLLSLSAHKFHGPKGVGALYVRKGVALEPLLYGGHSERERRAGTENVAGIVGMGAAAELARQRMSGDAVYLDALRARLERGLLERIPGACVNCGTALRIPNTTNVLLPGADSEALVIALDLAGLACSAGTACSAGAVSASPVLTAIGLAPDQARASIRLSLGRDNTEDDIDRAIELIPEAVARQRQISAPAEHKATAVRR